MTAQMAEIIIVEDRCCGLHSRPLDNFLARVGFVPEFCIRSTGNYRGYVGRWEIFDDRLYLTGIVGAGWIVPPHLAGRLPPDPDPYDGWPADTRTLRLADLFPDAGPAVPATWVTGVLTAVTGGRLVHVHAGFASLHASYRLINVVQGRVRQVRDLSARDWARRVGRDLPDDWFDEEPEPEAPDDGRPDWRADDSDLRWWSHELAQLHDLARPCGHRPDRHAPWPRCRDQRRRSRPWLTSGRR